jgi:hypothetical protein
MSEITEEDARWKPVPERFSIAEVLAHLSHSDGDCYRARLDRFLSEEMPEFEPDDAQMHLEMYKNGDPEEDFGHFEEQPQSRIWVGEFRSELFGLTGQSLPVLRVCRVCGLPRGSW